MQIECRLDGILSAARADEVNLQLAGAGGRGEPAAGEPAAEQITRADLAAAAAQTIASRGEAAAATEVLARFLFFTKG